MFQFESGWVMTVFLQSTRLRNLPRGRDLQNWVCMHSCLVEVILGAEKNMKLLSLDYLSVALDAVQSPFQN
jgi:hypothetical protein